MQVLHQELYLTHGEFSDRKCNNRNIKHIDITMSEILLYNYFKNKAKNAYCMIISVSSELPSFILYMLQSDCEINDFVECLINSGKSNREMTVRLG